MKKETFILLAIAAVLILAISGCQARQPTGQPGASQNATLAPVKSGDQIVSEGAVVPAQYANLSFSTQGVVGEVLFSEGQVVQSGQVIARLKGSARLEAALTGAQLELLSAQQALDDLNKNADVAKSAAQLKLAQANKDLDKAKDDRDSKNYVRASQSNIDAAHASFILAEDALKKAKDIYSGFEGKPEDDINRAAALTVLSRAQYERDRALANLNYAEARPDAFDVAIADGKLAVAQTAYDQAQRDWEKVKDGPDPELLSLAESRLTNAKAQIDAAKSALDDQELSAPFTGTVVSSDLKIGQQAGPATTPVVLADLSNYQVTTTDLTELNVVNIKPGAAVKITYDAVPGLDMSGKVDRIKSLGVDKQGDVTYTVYIILDQQDPRLRWNMTASVVFTAK